MGTTATPTNTFLPAVNMARSWPCLMATPVGAPRPLPRHRRWCAAGVSQAGHEIMLKDAHPATEGIGPVAGDEIVAEFAFAGGIHATFMSRAKYRAAAGPWGMELIASKGSVKIQMEMVPR